MFITGTNLRLPRSPQAYPVGIRLGSVALRSPRPESNVALLESSNWDLFPRTQAGDSIIGNFGWDDGSTDTTNLPQTVEQKLFPRYIATGDVGYFQEDPPILPVALYRQQIGWGTLANLTALPNADVVQVSPLITRVESSVITFSNRRFRAVTDPFVNAVMVHSSPNTLGPVKADLCLFDTTPVTYQAVYQYYLAHFDRRGEIDFILQAGSVAITQP